MKDPTVARISAAGLLHDLGKFSERAGDVSSHDPDWVRQEYNYAHAHHTSLAMEKCFGEVVNRSFSGEQADVTLANLASRHHKPRTDLEKILQKADWVASGHERREADDTSKNYETLGRERKSQIPLIALLGRISIDGKGEPKKARYRLRSLTEALNTPELLFPVAEEEYSSTQAKNDYQVLWQHFVSATAVWRNNGVDPIDKVEDLLELLRDYQWSLPASTRVEELPDVSLFEHQKGTAAIAAALYQVQKAKKDLLDGLMDDEEEKFILCGCDISGIQNFIYQISSKGAYRHLKGRSFYIQLLAEVVARDLLEGCGLTGVNLLYASGGKAYLLFGNTPEIEHKLGERHQRLNKDLREKYGHELYLRLSHVALSTRDLCRQKGRTLCTIWEDLTRQLGREDRHRLRDLPNDELKQLFQVPPEMPIGDCPVCHAPVYKKDQPCQPCTQLGELGRSLGRAEALIRSRGKGIFPGGWEIRAVSDIGELPGKAGERLLLLNRIPNRPQSGFEQSTSLMAGGNQHPKDDFESIAGLSRGIKRLGILRMDVDGLGKIFAEGLSHYLHSADTERSGRFYSLGRVTTLSWQLSTFFSVVLRNLVESHPENGERVTIVYSGGDDLFLLGAWDALPAMAAKIQSEFRLYCANNPVFTLSGGLVLTGGKFPIYKGAELAGAAEEKAKNYERKINGSKRKKQALCFLDEFVDWTEFETIQSWYRRLVEHCSHPEGQPLLRHLQKIADLWQLQKREYLLQLQRQGEAIDLRNVIKNIEAEKWCWRMVYSLKRYQQGHPDSSKLIQDLLFFITQPIPNGERQGIELLSLLCRWVELFLRKEINNSERRVS